MLQGRQVQRQVRGDGAVLEMAIVGGEQTELEVLGTLVANVRAADHPPGVEIPLGDVQVMEVRVMDSRAELSVSFVRSFRTVCPPPPIAYRQGSADLCRRTRTAALAACSVSMVRSRKKAHSRTS
jgi:hypothetical protein